MRNTKLPFVVAEVAQGYEGNPRMIELLCNSVAQTSADAIKFQIFYADELSTPDYQYYQLFKSLEVSFDVWERAVKQIHASGKLFYSDVFGLRSLASLVEVGVDGFKVHSTDISNIELLRQIAKADKKVLLSTGGCEPEEIERALSVLDKSKVTLMHGFQAEPTEIDDNHLLRISAIKERFGCPVGFQDHTAGDSPFNFLVPAVSIGVGATLVEKHITLSRLSLMEDYVSALTPEEFKVWCDQIKLLSNSLGSKEWVLNDKERLYRTKVKRAFCSNRVINQGEVLTLKDLSLKRSGNPLAIFDPTKVVGKRAKVQILENWAVQEDFFF